MRSLALALILLPTAGFAQDWMRVLNDEGVNAAIAGRTIVYDAYTFQVFGVNGDTQYVTERLSEGRWAARGGQYCSTWPPSDTWACYDLQISGDRVRFIAADRSVSEGQYKE